MTQLYTIYQMELIDTLVNLHIEREDIQELAQVDSSIKERIIEHMEVKDMTLYEDAVDTLESAIINIVDGYDKEILEGLINEYGFAEGVEIMSDGELYVFHDCYDMEAVAQQYLDETCSDLSYIIKDNERYIDESQLLHDLRCGGDLSEYYYHQALEDALEEGKTEEENILKTKYLIQ